MCFVASVGIRLFVLDVHSSLAAGWWSLQWVDISSVSVTPRAERCDWCFPAHFNHSCSQLLLLFWTEKCRTTSVAVLPDTTLLLQNSFEPEKKMRSLNRRKGTDSQSCWGCVHSNLWPLPCYNPPQPPPHPQLAWTQSLTRWKTNTVWVSANVQRLGGTF